MQGLQKKFLTSTLSIFGSLHATIAAFAGGMSDVGCIRRP